jgi:hypothetical protein
LISESSDCAFLQCIIRSKKVLAEDQVESKSPWLNLDLLSIDYGPLLTKTYDAES